MLERERQLEQVQFFCCRLKFSHFALVGLGDEQRTETLLRSMLEHFKRMGRIPLLAVFDRHGTMALKSARRPARCLSGTRYSPTRPSAWAWESISASPLGPIRGDRWRTWRAGSRARPLRSASSTTGPT